LSKRLILILFIFLIALPPMAFSLGGREKDKEPLEVIQVTGIVRLTGSDNFPEIIISNSEKSWVIAKEEMEKLKDQQHMTVTVEGQEIVTELRFANGLPAGLRYELRNVKIISVQQ
jgi:hypothetical protein